jgi:hypothetical protein
MLYLYYKFFTRSFMNFNKMLYNPPHPVKMLAHSSFSVNAATELISLLIPIPTCLLAELRTHRTLRSTIDAFYSLEDFSINANSDRAIPIATKIANCEKNPYYPVGSLKAKGMQGVEEVVYGHMLWLKEVFDKNRKVAIEHMLELDKAGFSKQVVNRLLMPHSWSSIVLTGSKQYFDAFFDLRLPLSVDPSFRAMAQEADETIRKSIPTILQPDEWHLAFPDEIAALNKENNLTDIDKVVISASCSARISFDIERDEPLSKHYDRAIRAFSEGHFSIFEHQALPRFMRLEQKRYDGSVKDWVLARRLMELGELKIERPS